MTVPYKAAVNAGVWRSFPSKEAAVAWVRRQCKRPTDAGWIHSADNFDGKKWKRVPYERERTEQVAPR